MKRRAKGKPMSNRVLYVGIDVHEKESQLAVLEKEGVLLLEERMPTKELGKFLSSLPGEKHVAMESVGFIHPIYEKLSSIKGCTRIDANRKLDWDLIDAKGNTVLCRR